MKTQRHWCPVAVAGHVSTQFTYFVICIIFWTSAIGKPYVLGRELEYTYLGETFFVVQNGL